MRESDEKTPLLCAGLRKVTMKPLVPVLLVLFLCLFAAGYSRAAQLTITKTEATNDAVCDADCSLREAVAAAVSGDTVVFSPLFNTPQTITLTLGQITIDKNLTITGTGQDLVTISGNMAGRIFFLSGDLNVTMSGIKLRDGKVGTTFGDAYGGAIAVLDGNGLLNLSAMEFTNNMAFYNGPPFPFGAGGAVYCNGCTMILINLNLHDNPAPGGGVIEAGSSGAITISDSVVTDNSAGIGADTLNMQNTIVSRQANVGISSGHLTLINSAITDNNGRGVFGGDAASTMTIEDSIISGNTGAGLSNSGLATIRNTLISNNQYIDSGGGVINGGTMYINDSAIIGNSAAIHGGGVKTHGGHLFLTNSTVSGNIANGGMATTGLGGGIYVLVNGANPNGRVTVTNSTISNNQSKGGGGGIRLDSGGTATTRNSIIAGNTSTDTNEEDVSGTFTSQGTNLIGNTPGSSGWIATDLLNVNPMLGPLADNGGPTMTHSHLPGSPAINAGNNSVAIDPQTQMPLTTDQRGFLRVYDGTVDIGAYEIQPSITGAVVYGNAAGPPTPRFISGVLLSAVGSPNVSAISSAVGTYALGGFGSGSYTVTPSKSGGANGISSFDAGLIARHATGITPLIGNQLIVADVSGNGTVSSFDAGQAARYTAGIKGFGSAGNWIFIPANRTYSSVNSTVMGEDFIALLMGEVSGNWMPMATNKCQSTSNE
jgi:hypothetical protein